jgi:hypothetical protein
MPGLASAGREFGQDVEAVAGLVGRRVPARQGAGQADVQLFLADRAGAKKSMSSWFTRSASS